MNKTKNIPIGIMLFITFIVILNLTYLFYLIFYMMLVEGYLTIFLTFSPLSLMMWIDVFLTIPALFIIPYGFIKRKNWARIYAILLLVWSTFGAIGYIILTGEIATRYILFNVYMLFMMYLLLSPVQEYFGKNPRDTAPEITTFTYGEYTLYSKLVRLKSGKIQIIYFFSKKIPKSGRPAVFPDGYKVEVSMRSGLPYLKKI